MTHRDSADSSDCHWSAERPNREMTACISCLSPCLRKVLAAAVQQIVNFWPFVNPIRKVPLCGRKRYYRWSKQCPQEVRCQAKTSRPDEWRALSFFCCSSTGCCYATLERKFCSRVGLHQTSSRRPKADCHVCHILVLHGHRAAFSFSFAISQGFGFLNLFQSLVFIYISHANLIWLCTIDHHPVIVCHSCGKCQLARS